MTRRDLLYSKAHCRVMLWSLFSFRKQRHLKLDCKLPLNKVFDVVCLSDSKSLIKLIIGNKSVISLQAGILHAMLSSSCLLSRLCMFLGFVI